MQMWTPPWGWSPALLHTAPSLEIWWECATPKAAQNFWHIGDGGGIELESIDRLTGILIAFVLSEDHCLAQRE